MKNEKMKVAMVRMTNSFIPFVEVFYQDKDAKEHPGMMLVDSGSNQCVLACEMVERLGILQQKEGEVTKILTASGKVVESYSTMFTFAMGGEQFQENFCICEAFHENCFGYLPFIGILGSEFMQKHGLAIDYSEGSFHTSDVSPSNLSTSDCEFFCTMMFGLKYYGAPVVAFMQNGKEILTLVDTGATNNVIAKQSLMDNAFKHKLLNEKDTMNGLSGGVEVEDAVVGFNLLNLRNEEPEENYHQDLFKLYPHYVMPATTIEVDGKTMQLSPVEALVGSSFIASQGWVLDFGAKIIYKRKKALKEAV